MVATVVLAGFGFFFWLINARLFSVSSIGIATTLISVMNLIALLSLLGLDTTLVRFLPTSTQRNEKINTALLLVSTASIILSSGFVLFVKEISPNLSFIQDNTWYFSIFILSCVMNSLNVLTDSVFLAGKKTKYTLIVNVISSLVKTGVPFAFVGFGAMGIFIAAGLAQMTGTLLSMWIMLRRFDYRPQFTINTEALSGVWRYSGVNYATSILNLLPPTLLPILIINTIGTEAAAYYYIVMMIGNLLYAIPWSAAKSFFAESSHNVLGMPEHIRRAVRTIAFLTFPAMLVIFIFGRTILTIFGEKYASGGISFLYFVTVAAVLISINAIYGSIFKVLNNLKAIFTTNVLYVVSIFLAAYIFHPYGLVGVGLAWLIGATITSIANAVFYKSSLAR
jgi:O-antigen/teichoic acid export membrane protein